MRTQVQALQPTPTEEGRGTGLISGAGAPLVGGVLVVLALVGGFLFFRNRGEKGGMEKATPSTFFEGNVDALFKSPSKFEVPESQPRKFSTLGGNETGERALRENIENNPPERSSGKVHFGDLIKHERD